VSAEAMKILLNYNYPGNVRELENIVERLVTLEAGDWLTRDGLPYHMMQEQGFNQLAEDMEIPDEGLDLEGMVERLERNLLLKALLKSGGVRKNAAELLGISFRSIRYRLDKYGINEDEFTPS
jgi:two-component system response regulator PilR (NtrC family)